MNRILTFDYMRGAAIIAVVMMHNTLTYVFKPAEIVVDSFLHNAVTVGVPAFFFLSGYFLAYRREPRFGPFVKKKFAQVFLPAAVWTIVFWIVLGVTGESRALDLSTLISNIAFFRDPEHYYFIFVLMILFVGGYFVAGTDTARLKTIVQVSFVVNLITIAAYEIAVWTLPTESLSGAAMYRNPTAWVFFFAYGLYVCRTDKDLGSGWLKFLDDRRRLGLAVTIGLWIVTSLETTFLFERLAPGGQDYFKVASFLFEFLALNYLLIAFKRFRGETVIGRLLLFLAKYSFLIYLIHLPSVPKLLGVGRLVAMSQQHYLSMIATVALSFGIPLALALAVRGLKPLPRLRASVSRLIGLPVER